MLASSGLTCLIKLHDISLPVWLSPNIKYSLLDELLAACRHIGDLLAYSIPKLAMLYIKVRLFQSSVDCNRRLSLVVVGLPLFIE